MAPRRQPSLPGTSNDRPFDKDVELAAEAFSKAAASLSRARKKTGESKAALIQLLKDKGWTAYKAEDGCLYSLTPGKDKITVTEPGAEDDGDESEGDD